MIDPFDPAAFLDELHALFQRNAATGDRSYDSDLVRAMALMIDRVPDAMLLAAYQRTTGEPGDPEADALLGEIERRGLNV